MKLFIDTANIEHIRIASKWGVISGATTNPSLIAKEGRQLVDVVKEIVDLIESYMKNISIENISEIIMNKVENQMMMDRRRNGIF